MEFMVFKKENPMEMGTYHEENDYFSQDVSYLPLLNSLLNRSQSSYLTFRI